MSLEKDALGLKAIANVSVVDDTSTEKPVLVDPVSDVNEKRKDPSIEETSVSSATEVPYDTTSDDVAEIPELVRNIVSFEDDPTLPVITFRSVLLSVLFCIVGSFVSQLS